MNPRKQQKEIDKAIANLIKYGDNEPWADRQQYFFPERLKEAADSIDVPVDEFGQTLADSGYMDMIHGYLFELFASCHWDNEDFSMTSDYVERRGWREAPYGKRYLGALADSIVELLEATTVNQGHWVEVRPVGTTIKPIRVYERAGSKNLKRWDCMAARVLTVDGKSMFGGGILLFSPSQAQQFSNFLNLEHYSVVELLNEARKEDSQCQWSDEEVGDMAASEVDAQLPELLFTFWVCETYQALVHPMIMPTLANKEGDLFQLIKIKFPMAINDKATIEHCLNADPSLDLNSDTNEWVWLDSEKDKVTLFETTVLGHISLTDKHLIATVNSSERAEIIKSKLNEMLADRIGSPLAIHENIQAMMGDMSAKERPPSEQIDAPELITAYLDQHYRKTLDEPIPMLNDLTPRECSKRTGQRAMLIQWLKELENNTAAVEHMAHYDFKWMWKELNVELAD
jgi:hypothetical protein